MFCNKCGKQIADDAKYCGKCGHPTALADNIQANAPMNSIQQTPVIVKKGSSGAVQIVLLTLILIVFIVILLTILSMSKANSKSTVNQSRQNFLAERERIAKEQLILNYETYQGSWKVTEAMVNGKWTVFSGLSEIVGTIADLGFKYYFDADTNFGAPTTIYLNSDSVDLTCIGLGVYSIENFVYNQSIYGSDDFTNESQGIKLSWIKGESEPYLLVSILASDGKWHDLCSCKKI